MNKTKILILLIAVVSLACSVTMAPLVNTSPVPTGQPTVTRPARVKLSAVAETPVSMVVCVDHANARKQQPNGDLAVIKRLERDNEVTLTGDVIEIGGEKWQPTNYGLIDPKLLCFL